MLNLGNGKKGCRQADLAEEANFALDAAIVSLSFFGFITHVRISWAFVYAFFALPSLTSKNYEWTAAISGYCLLPSQQPKLQEEKNSAIYSYREMGT